MKTAIPRNVHGQEIPRMLPTIEGSPPKEELRRRAIRRMRQGLDLGGPPYPSREELYGFDSQHDQEVEGVNPSLGLPPKD
jgi:hypothetical protein